MNVRTETTIHLERADRHGTVCGLDYGSISLDGEVITDRDEWIDATCAECKAQAKARRRSTRTR